MNFKFKSNTALTVKYQAVLFKSIVPADLIKLASLENFSAARYRAPGQEATEDNHSQSDALFDFVRNVAPEMTQKNLNLAVMVLLQEEAKDSRTFLRNTCLVKHLLAYQSATYPEDAALHFENRQYRPLLEKQGGVDEFTKRMIRPIAEQFKTGSFDAQVDRSAEEARIFDLVAQKTERVAEAKEAPSLPISFFMVMSHPAAKITSTALLAMGLATLLAAGLALYGVAAAAGLAAYATTNVLSAASTASVLGTLGLLSGAKAGKDEPGGDLKISSPLPV